MSTSRTAKIRRLALNDSAQDDPCHHPARSELTTGAAAMERLLVITETLMYAPRCTLPAWESIIAVPATVIP